MSPRTTDSTRWGSDHRAHGGRYDTLASKAQAEGDVRPIFELSCVGAWERVRIDAFVLTRKARQGSMAPETIMSDPPALSG